jgi:hypothetical protein
MLEIMEMEAKKRKEKQEAERKANNEQVKRSYRLKPKGKQP